MYQLGDVSVAKLFNQMIPTMIRAKQALGRTIRNPNDRGGILFLDNRTDQFLQQHLLLARYTKFQDCLEDVQQFFNEADQ